MKLFIKKLTNHKYTFIDAQMYADIKYLMGRMKIEGMQGMEAEAELGGIIETLRKNDINWYSTHIYMALAVTPVEGEGWEDPDTTTHFELGYLNMKMARYGVWDPQKGNTTGEKETLLEFGKWARQHEGRNEEEWIEVKMEGPEQTCDNACVIFVLIAMKYVNDPERIPKKHEFNSTDMPWMRSYVAYIVIGGKTMERIKEQEEKKMEEDKQDAGGW